MDHNAIKLELVKKDNKNILHNTLLNNSVVKEKVSSEIRKYFKQNENKNATYQNLLYAAKQFLEGNL